MFGVSDLPTAIPEHRDNVALDLFCVVVGVLPLPMLDLLTYQQDRD